MQLTQRPDETPFDYHKRLVYGKLVDRTLADADYSELSEILYGKPYASDVARRMMYGSCRTLELLDEQRAQGVEEASERAELDMKLADLEKEKQKYRDMRNEFTRVVRERSRQEEVYELIEKALAGGNLPTLDYEPADVPEGDTDILVSLNDIHYGAAHDNYWGQYNSDICANMMRQLLDKTLEIARRHGCENCIVWENGDAISGLIHENIRISNKENVVEQIMGVSELIAEFLAALSPHFGYVKFASVAGNHSRINPNKDDAVLGERLDDMVEWYLRARLQNFKNIVIGADVKIDPTMYMIDIRGKKYVGVHGDFDPSDSRVHAIESMVREPLYAILMGHKHHNKVDEVHGIKTVMAGSFLGVDDYCVQKRIFGRPEQMICVCDSRGIVCHYDALL